MQLGDCFCNDVFHAMQTVYWEFEVTRFEYVTLFSGYYRPQRSWSKVIFLHLSVSHSVLRGFCHTPLRQTPLPPWAVTPYPLGRRLPFKTHKPTPLGRHTPAPLGRHPLWADPAGRTPPWADTLSLCAVHAGIRSTSGRYASYWNASFFWIFLKRSVWITRSNNVDSGF